MKGEEKREIRVVGVEQVQGTQVEDVVARNRREEGVQKVVFFLIELGVVDAEDFIEVGASAVHLGQFEIVNHYGERKLAKVVSAQLNLGNAFAELPDLGFLGIVEEHVLRGGVVQTDLASERTLGVVKVAALGLDKPAHLAGILFFPLRDDVVVGFHFEKPLKDEGKALGGRFLERQDLDVVVVHTEMPAVAFQKRFGKVVVEESVVLELRVLEFVRVEIQRSLENAEGFLFVEHPEREEIADLQDEAAGFLKQRCLSVADMLAKSDDLLPAREMRPHIRQSLFRILGKCGERGS